MIMPCESGELLRKVQSRPHRRLLDSREHMNMDQEETLRNIIEREVALQHRVLSKIKEFAKLGHDIADMQVYKQVLSIAGMIENNEALKSQIDMQVLDRFLKKYGHKLQKGMLLGIVRRMD